MYVCVSLLQIKSTLTLISHGIPNQATLLFNRPTRGMLPKCSRPPILCNDDKSNFTTLVDRKPLLKEDIMFTKLFLYNFRLICSSKEERQWTVDTQTCN